MRVKELVSRKQIKIQIETLWAQMSHHKTEEAGRVRRMMRKTVTAMLDDRANFSRNTMLEGKMQIKMEQPE